MTKNDQQDGHRRQLLAVVVYYSPTLYLQYGTVLDFVVLWKSLKMNPIPYEESPTVVTAARLRHLDLSWMSSK
jgi:hypothetical protein